MNITINEDVTINLNGTEANARVTSGKQEQQGMPQECPVDHSKDVLISNDTTFFGLLEVLQRSRETVDAEKAEMDRKRTAEEQQALKATLGELYQDVVTKEEEMGIHQKEKRRPGAVQLWNRFSRIASIEIGGDGRLDVFTNGYAVYDNGDRRTVLWVPDCGSVSYYFCPLTDKERDYLTQWAEVGEDILGVLPWYQALMIAGENSIEANLSHPKSDNSSSASEDDEEMDGKPNYHWSGGCRFETPEEYVLRREREEERRNSLPLRQRNAYHLYYEMGYTQVEIGRIMGIGHQRVSRLLKKAVSAVRDMG